MQDSQNHKPRLITKSTRAFIKKGLEDKNYSLGDFIHGYVYARWPYLYIGIGTGQHPLSPKLAKLVKFWNSIFPSNGKPKQIEHDIDLASNSIADGYHGKVTPLDTAKQLVMVNEPIQVNDLEQVIPYVRARAILQENPDHIVVLDCPCRSTKPDPCLPLDVCLVIGEPFASFILDHQPEHSRWITQEEAVEILEAEDARGHVHHAFFKDAMLGRFYAICNCCACCCGAMHAHYHGTPMLAASGYVAEIDSDICIACDTCSEYCQFDALCLADGCGSVDQEKCMGCGVCVSKCPEGAISMIRSEEKGIPLEIHKLMSAAAGSD